MKKIMVFGATGLLGAYISVYFKNKGWDVVAVGRRESDNGFFGDHGIEYYSVDITKKESFSKLPVNDISVVAHFAGDLPASMKGYDGSKYIDSVIKGTYNVMEFIHANSIRKIIFPQTLFDVSYMFGTKNPIPANAERRVPEDGDHCMYVIAKNAAVDIINHYYKVYGIKRFILRLSRVYAYHPNPFTFTDGKRVMVSDRLLIQKAERGETLSVWGDPNRILETCSMPDFLQIVERCALSENDGGIYNIGSGGSTLEERIKGIVEVFSPNSDKSGLIYEPEKRPSTQFVLDITETMKDLGYKPKLSWKDYCIWFKNERKAQRFAKLWGCESDYK